MRNQYDQAFTDETVTKGRTISESDRIPAVEDSKYEAEGMDAMNEEVKESDAQLGTLGFSLKL